MKTIKGEKIGRSFGGDIYRGSDGNTYWKGDRNGYVEETLETQRKKARQANNTQGYEVQNSGAYSNHYGSSGAGSGWMAALGGSVLIAALSVVTIIASVIYTGIFVWPNFIRLLISVYSQGAISVPLIVLSAVVVFWAGYLIYCLFRVAEKGAAIVIRYAIICICCIAIPYIVMDIPVLTFSIVIERLLFALGFAILPTCILWYARNADQKG